MAPADPIKFLLVDDRDANLLALEALLRRDDLLLFKARSGPEALELMLTHDFALALLDVQMAEMDGFELAQLMRGAERTRRIPIIFVTAVATDEKRRFRGYEAGAVDYILKPIDPQVLRNKADVFFELARQRQEIARQRDELQATAVQLAGALGRVKAHGDNSPLAVVEYDPEFRLIAWSQGAERMFGWKTKDVIGRRIPDLRFIHEEERDAFARQVADMVAGNQPRGVAVHRTHRRDGSLLECEWYSSVLLDKGGAPISINSQILDVTERRSAEETQQLLVGELNHRVKNTLATVQAIATQTLRHSPDPAEFTANFSGRIQALSRAHSLLSNETWAGADLTELVQDQLRMGATDETRLAVSGPAVRLSAQGALHLALVLHELGTNARKYGALSVPDGQVALSWTVSDDRLRLSWTERGGPPAKAPSRRGFGTTLIERSVKAEGGSAQASYRADGIAWEIDLALPKLATSALADRSTATVPLRPGQPPANAGHGAIRQLTGRRFLIVEDEPLVALEMAAVLEDAGAMVIGPAATAAQALKIIETTPIEGALLDGNLRGEPVDGIAAALTQRRVPFLFVSGYGREGLPAAFSRAPVVTKPFSPVQLLEAAERLAPPSGDVLVLRR